MKKTLIQKSRGRPRAFDVDRALEQAMRIFWKKGFEGTSLPDLTDAMGINRPSLYSAFGNKQSLFRKAVDRYVEQGARRFEEAMSLPTARESIETVMRNSIGSCSTGKQRGCLLVQGAMCGSEESECVREDLANRRAAIQTALQRRFDKALLDGEQLPTKNTAELARYFATVMHGMAVQSVGTVQRDQLLAVVDLAMRVWPERHR
jgi:AcrR family transcriptional regulator